MQSHAFQRGYKDFILGKTIFDNPYKKDLHKNSQWLKGLQYAANRTFLSPEKGRPEHPNADVNVVRNGVYKDCPDPKHGHVDFDRRDVLELEFIKPPSKKFNRWASNPPHVEWRGKVAQKTKKIGKKDGKSKRK